MSNSGLAFGGFLYDSEGNMTYDPLTGVGIEYNFLNLPQRIFDSSEEITYIYTADGRKLGSSSGGSLTLYQGVMVMGGMNGTDLMQIMHPEGFVALEGNSFVYKYLIKDHLGSTRSVISARNIGGSWSMETEQETDYYAYGLAHSYSDLQLNKYLFSGKEIQDAQIGNSGMLGFYDFGSRYYNPVLGRWFNPDPAQQLANPYIYCGNNPVMFVDPNGEWFFKALLSPLGPLGVGIGTVLDAAAWGATIGAATYTFSVAVSPGGFDNWSWGAFGTSVGIGAINGAVSFGIGEMFKAADISKAFVREMVRATVHGLAQSMVAAATGGDPLSAFASASLSSLIGHGAEELGMNGSKLDMLLTGGLTGGLGSVIMGGNFWDGVGSGLIVTGLNQLQHKPLNWEKASDKEKLEFVIEGIRKSEKYFDIRENSENFPLYGSGESSILAEMNIDGTLMPVHMSVANQRIMKVENNFQMIRRQYFNIRFSNGFLKKGDWESYRYNTYRANPRPNTFGIPLVEFWVPVKHSSTFFNYMTK